MHVTIRIPMLVPMVYQLQSHYSISLFKKALLSNVRKCKITFEGCVALPIAVSGRSPRTNAGAMGSNPTRGMGHCVLLFCLCCPVRTASVV
jgi:hypothetical protein